MLSGLKLLGKPVTEDNVRRIWRGIWGGFGAGEKRRLLVRKLRERGYTKSEIARLVGVTSSTVSLDIFINEVEDMGVPPYDATPSTRRRWINNPDGTVNCARRMVMIYFMYRHRKYGSNREFYSEATRILGISSSIVQRDVKNAIGRTYWIERYIKWAEKENERPTV